MRVWRLGPDGVSNSIDFNSPDAAQGSCYTGMQMEAGGKISAITCNPAVKGCMALTTPSRLRVMDVEIGREFSSRDCEADGGVHSMCWTPTGASCLLSLKNRTIITHDPRAPTLAASVFPGHSTVSPNRLAYLKGNHFCSTGKGAGRTRARTHALALNTYFVTRDVCTLLADPLPQAARAKYCGTTSATPPPPLAATL